MEPPTAAPHAMDPSELRAIIEEFVGRMTADPMIGFFFAKVDRQRLEQMEFEHAAEFLGLPGVRYSGRPLAAAHGPHRIFGGQFARRREILRRVLIEREVPVPMRDAWLAHVDSLRSQITRDPGSECR